MMLPRVRAGPLGGASIYSGLSTSPWKPNGCLKRPQFVVGKKIYAFVITLKVNIKSMTIFTCAMLLSD